MLYKVKYSIPFSPDPEVRDKIFEEDVYANHSQEVRKNVFGRHPNASIISVDPIRH